MTARKWFLAAFGIIALLATSPMAAQAHWRDGYEDRYEQQEWRRHMWRERERAREWREHEWREHHRWW